MDQLSQHLQFQLVYHLPNQPRHHPHHQQRHQLRHPLRHQPPHPLRRQPQHHPRHQPKHHPPRHPRHPPPRQQQLLHRDHQRLRLHRPLLSHHLFPHWHRQMSRPKHQRAIQRHSFQRLRFNQQPGCLRFRSHQQRLHPGDQHLTQRLLSLQSHSSQQRGFQPQMMRRWKVLPRKNPWWKNPWWKKEQATRKIKKMNNQGKRVILWMLLLVLSTSRIEKTVASESISSIPFPE
mmetsp:Transcript_4080/g.11708  ORF Transcript_4080/g.11708 Transcript_4080/m.11708 type:complete len:233 (-) Transcript_4080:538-1236(-)